MKLPRLIVIGALAIGGCGADSATFSTTNPASRHAGQPAASYDIRVGPNTAPHVHVNVWSRGATEQNGRTLIDLAMEVRNTGDRVLRLDPDELRLDAFGARGGQLPPAQLVHMTTPDRSVQVPPGEATTIRLQFATPVRIEPEHIASIRLRWAIDHEDGQRYVQLTEFQQIRDESGMTYDPVWGYYDPFLYGATFYGYHSRYGVPIGRVHVRDRGLRTSHR